MQCCTSQSALRFLGPILLRVRSEIAQNALRLQHQSLKFCLCQFSCWQKLHDRMCTLHVQTKENLLCYVIVQVMYTVLLICGCSDVELAK